MGISRSHGEVCGGRSHLHCDFHPLIQVTMRGRRSKLSLLISTATLAPSVRAALLPHLAGLRRQAALTTMRRDFASAPPWERPPDELRAVCDHRTRTCRLFSTSRSGGGRARSPSMQAAECASPPAEEMATQYAPAEVEQRLYEWWEKSGYFQPAKDSDQECFVISMPPPNVTGRLHMGHAMFVALEDIMARFQRMRGRPTLWLPGTDHAGIATQMLVERSLRADGIERKALGREKFLERVWSWKEM